MRRRQVSSAVATALSVILSVASLAHGYIHLPRDIAANFARSEVRVQTYDRNGQRPGEVGGAAGEMKSVTLTDTHLGYNYTFTSMTWCECQGKCHCGHPRTRLTITSLHISGDQTTRVFVPSDAPPLMKAHEQGHYDLDAYAYNQARFKAEVFARGMIRRTLDGGCLDEAKAQLDACFRDEFQNPFFNWRNTLHAALNDFDGNGCGQPMTPANAVRRVLSQQR